MTVRHRPFAIIFFSLFILLCPGMGTSAPSPFKVLVLPFDVHADKDLSFLKKGIEDMLTTRLALKDKVVLIDKGSIRQAMTGMDGFLDESTAFSLGAALHADYVVYGSLTVFGDSISTDARLANVPQQTPLVVFNKTGTSHGDLIQHIDLFARQVTDTLFGPQSEAPSTIPTDRQGPDIHAHPEKLWTGDLQMEKQDNLGTEGGDVVLASTLWKSRSFNFEIKGLALGDTTGDHRNETVFISDNTLFIYRYDEERFVRFREFQGGRFEKFLGVDVADINQNGLGEIFVTCLVQKDTLQSFVLEWNGTDYSKIADRENWYYRVVRVPTRGTHLFGQNRGIGESELFKPGIYELIWENGRYVPMDKQPLPRETMVFGFAYGDVLSNGQESVVMFSQTDHLRILDKAGKEEWKSSDPLGGGAVYLEFPEELYRREAVDRAYLPQRIQIVDLNGDGKNEVIVANNRDASGRVLARTRIYKDGYITGLAWETLGLYPIWRTRNISGFISDVAVNDFDQDGQDDIVFSVVDRGGMLSSSQKSYIVSWKVGS